MIPGYVRCLGQSLDVSGGGRVSVSRMCVGRTTAVFIQNMPIGSTTGKLLPSLSKAEKKTGTLNSNKEITLSKIPFLI